jgi:hypothetical protein
MTNKEIAIKVEGVSKTFKITHEKITSLFFGVFAGASKMKEGGCFRGIINKIATLDKFSVFAIIEPAKTTRYDPLGMAGFF